MKTKFVEKRLGTLNLTAPSNVEYNMWLKFYRTSIVVYQYNQQTKPRGAEIFSAYITHVSLINGQIAKQKLLMFQLNLTEGHT